MPASIFEESAEDQWRPRVLPIVTNGVWTRALVTVGVRVVLLCLVWRQHRLSSEGSGKVEEMSVIKTPG